MFRCLHILWHRLIVAAVCSPDVAATVHGAALDSQAARLARKDHFISPIPD